MGRLLCRACLQSKGRQLLAAVISPKESCLASKARKKKKRSRPKSPSGLRWLWRLLAVAVVVAALALLVLDAVVYQKFSGKKWSLPSHVYSRALELYQGQSIGREQLQWELDNLGYRRVSAAKEPGQYSVSSTRVELFSRGFEFWDGSEPARLMRVSFRGDSVAALSDSRGGNLTLARLEPVVIGGIYPSHKEDRELVQLAQLPAYLPEGLVAVEDQAFYRHHGVSLRGIARAMVANLKQGRFAQGGSTLTQQLVKNFYLNQRRTLSRKVQEALMAVLLEVHFSKEEILETYINEVYLGQAGERAVHGFGLASRHYFQRPVEDLELHQVALLIGMVKGASYYNPWRQPERALQRRNLVLNLMAEQGVVTSEQAQRARQKPLGVVPQQNGRGGRWQYPAFLDLVKRRLREHYDESDLQTEGLRIFTHFDPQVQRKLEARVERRIANLEQGYHIAEGQLQGAAVIVRVGSGEVVAMAGDRQAGYAGFNRALDARRQIGSTVKPAVYLTALEKPSQYTLASLIDDAPLSVEGVDGDVWEPRNFGRESHGPIPLYQALGQSYNQAAARLGLELGVDSVVNTLHRLGYEGRLPALPSLTLGAVSMSPVEVAQIYHTIAANGFYTPLRAIDSVFTATNTPLQRYPFKSEQRFDPKTMHLLQYAMQVVLREGTGKSAYRRLPESLVLAGKTGTTNDQRDSWFAGFSGNYLSVVWMGRDDNGKTPLTGGTGALQLWTDIMSGLDNRSMVFNQPEGVSYHWVEPATGRLSREGCSGARYLPFVDGSEPQQYGACRPASFDGVIDWFKDKFGW
ncbi:MAG: penicillin-binding protein 1B [Gammaproteobacteria bacterium]|nr:MAG: penicillin-binding protein 1B [Gammaproteobacteria bacterium]